jgi:hypothetical protein
MFSPKLIRLGAPGALVAGVAWIVSFIIVVIDFATRGLIPIFGFPYSNLGRTVYIVVLMSMLWGLVGLHAAQEKRYGRLGTIGFFVAYFGSTLALIGLGITWLFTSNVLGQEPAVTLGISGMGVGLMFVGIGFLLLGIATVRARVLPRWCGVSLIVAFVAVLVSLGFPASLGAYAVMIVLGFVWLTLGYVLWKRQSLSAT